MAIPVLQSTLFDGTFATTGWPIGTPQTLTWVLNPAAVALNDLMLFMCSIETGANATCNPPAGNGVWTLVGSDTTTVGVAAFIGIWWKVANATDVAGFTYSITANGDNFGQGNNRGSFCTVARVTGAGTNSPISLQIGTSSASQRVPAAVSMNVNGWASPQTGSIWAYGVFQPSSISIPETQQVPGAVGGWTEKTLHYFVTYDHGSSDPAGTTFPGATVTGDGVLSTWYWGFSLLLPTGALVPATPVPNPHDTDRGLPIEIAGPRNDITRKRYLPNVRVFGT
jgi:hypothetical protein